MVQVHSLQLSKETPNCGASDALRGVLALDDKNLRQKVDRTVMTAVPEANVDLATPGIIKHVAVVVAHAGATGKEVDYQFFQQPTLSVVVAAASLAANAPTIRRFEYATILNLPNARSDCVPGGGSRRASQRPANPGLLPDRLQR